MIKLGFNISVMENKKVSAKALKSLLNDSLHEAIGKLELPEPTKKLDKLISKSSKKIATGFADLLKKEHKKNKKAEKSLSYVEDVLSGKKQKKTKKEKSMRTVSI
jgi:hypothetical protein